MEEIPAKIIINNGEVYFAVHMDYWDKLKKLLAVKKGGRNGQRRKV